MKVIHGDLLEQKGFIIHGCNTQGVMGSGVAAAVRAKWEHVYEAYKTVCDLSDDTEQLLGHLVPVSAEAKVVVINAFTQHLYGTQRRQVNYEAVAKSFEQTTALMNRYKTVTDSDGDVAPTKLFFPLIGAGLGGGNWRIIREIIVQTVPAEFEPTLVLLSGMMEPQ